MELKRGKVVMLPTSEKATGIIVNTYTKNKNIVSPKVKLGLEQEMINSEYTLEDRGYEYQHLHITTEEDIKKDNWYMNITGIYNYGIHFPANIELPKYTNRKIIASTDESLGLPKPKQSFINKFIEEYNKGNIIEDILIEYNCRCCGLKGGDNMHHKIGCDYKDNSLIEPKVSKDNTITIKKIKDSWNHEEVENLLIEFNNLMSDNQQYDIELIKDFVNKNL